MGNEPCNSASVGGATSGSGIGAVDAGISMGGVGKSGSSSAKAGNEIRHGNSKKSEGRNGIATKDD